MSSLLPPFSPSLSLAELVHLLESPAELKSRVAEAIQVLREHLAATNAQ